MKENEINKIVNNQRKYFYYGVTLDVNFRIEALKKLRACILKYESEINASIKKDLGKSHFETYMCETKRLFTVHQCNYENNHKGMF